MIRTLIHIVLVALVASLHSLADELAPAEQYRSLLRTYNSVGGSFRAAVTDQQRKAAVEEFGRLPRKFIALAEENPRAPIALKALRQAVQGVISTDSLAHHASEINREAFPIGSRDEASQIVEILLRDHLTSEKIAPICDRMRFGVRKEFEEFLVATMEKNPHRDVQGMACLALAQLLHTHLRMIELMADRPELNARYETLYGRGIRPVDSGERRSHVGSTS